MPEIFGSASYYGIGKLLKGYSGFPVFLPLPVNIQHGFVGGHVSSHDARRDAPENWFWDEKTLMSHRSAFPGIKVRAVGAPFLYLMRSLNYSESAPDEKRGTIVFPSHSTDHIKVTADFDSFAKQLSMLPERFHPVTVCAYHIDFNRGVYQPFVDKGFDIVTNGSSLYDATFLKNFIDNARGKAFAMANMMSSALYYANAMGMVSYLMGPSPGFDNKDPHLTQMDLKEEFEKDDVSFGKYFMFPDVKHEVQNAHVAMLLGRDFLLSPGQMNKLLWRNAFTWKYVLLLLKTVAYFFLVPGKRYMRKIHSRILGKKYV